MAFVVLFLSCNHEVVEAPIGNKINEEDLIEKNNRKKNNLTIYVEGWSCVYRIELSEEGKGEFVRGYSETDDLGKEEFTRVYETYTFEVTNTIVLDSIHSVIKHLSADVNVVDNLKMSDEKRMLLKYNDELRLDAYNLSGADEIYTLLKLMNPYLQEDFIDVCR